jgi:DNA-binding MltR family transcriptional regulator
MRPRLAAQTAAPKPTAADSFDSFADDMLAERSARPLIIVGASKVDDLLAEILLIFLLPKIAKPKEQDELLEGDKPLGTFSARIRMCRRLGLIEETLYLALDRLRILRNLCAHAVSFDDSKSPVRDHLAELRKHIVNRRSYILTKRRYFENLSLQPMEELQCLLLTLSVLLQAIWRKVKRTRGNGHALRISSR